MKPEKERLRQKMQALRLKLQANYAQAALDASENFLRAIQVPNNATIAGYSPLPSELPTFPLLEALHKREYTCCLPVVEEHTLCLGFREWTPNTEMLPGVHGIAIPAHTRLLEPTVLIVPLLAFTRPGHRLGFGKGHYDCTLEHLRGKKEILAIGYAFAQQEVDIIPQDHYDQTLDWIITNQEAIKVNP